MNEWAIIWTAILSAGSLIGITLVVRPLMKTVRALEQAVKAQKDTIDAAKSLNDLTAATLAAVRPREVLQDVAALRELFELKAQELIDQDRRKLETDRKELDKSRGSMAMATLMIFARWVPVAERESAITSLQESKPAREMDPSVFELLRAWVPMLEMIEARAKADQRARMGGFAGIDPLPPPAPPPPPAASSHPGA
jgi:hypothetical protein